MRSRERRISASVGDGAKGAKVALDDVLRLQIAGNLHQTFLAPVEHEKVDLAAIQAKSRNRLTSFL